MPEFLLRCEAVNLDNFVYDTQDLSTVRGGSLLLLESVAQAAKWLQERANASHGTLETVSRGASIGLFHLTLPNGDSESAGIAETIRRELEEKLRHDPGFRHATFVIDVLPFKELPADRERLLALNRFRQARQPSMAVPSWNRDPRVTTACKFDKVRPASTQSPKAGTNHPASEATHQRSLFGKKKYEFFVQHAGDVAKDMKFVWDLDHLTTNRDKGNLHHKMAVFYADGNRFSGKQEKLCLDIPRQQAWDTYLRGERRDLLGGLLSLMKKDQGSWTDGQHFQVESLLWGGDELTWVVPAWQGWATATHFFGATKGWAFGGERLTHGAGLVFCHHNAPIHRITRLAHDLAERAKVKNRSENLVAYQVLESFDDVGTELDEVRARRYAKGGNLDDLILPGEALANAVKPVSTLKQALPRSRLVSLVLALQRGTKAATKHEEKLRRALEDPARQALEELEHWFGPPPALWFHLAELWDYIGA